MCGIVALFSKQKPISELPLKQGMDCLSHRGPDGQKSWFSADKRVALGHTRLSIIDINGGEQPITNQDKSLHIIANGEFYEFEQIQRDLKRWGYQLQSNSDSEIALHLYNEFGTQCLHYLRGEFAFIIWDEHNKLLFAARDRFGIKPLYYSIYDNILYLASEVKALFAAGVPAYWDRESFLPATCHILAPDRTLFANVYQVPPGHFMLASHYGVKLHRYWDFDYPLMNNSTYQHTPEDYIEKLRYSLNKAIQMRLRADVPVGCYLSGGLDSSTVLGIAATHNQKPIDAFTVTFDNEAYNEESLACETAAKIGANLHVIPIRQSDLAENFADSIWYSEMICSNGQMTAKYLLSKFARDAGYKVILTGEGADEIFGGYIYFQADHTALQEPIRARRSDSSITLSFLNTETSTQALNSVQRLLGFVPCAIKCSTIQYLASASFYSREFMSQVAHQDMYRIFFNQIDVQGQLRGREYLYQSLYLWSKTILPNYIFRQLGDGVEMANSIEGRLPFLDHKVFELVRNIPSSLKIKGMTEKYVLREAAKPFITDAVYHRRKHTFAAPPSTLKPNDILHQLIQDTLRSSAMSFLPFYNQASVIQLLDQLPTINKEESSLVDSILLTILSACLLQEKFRLA